MVQQTAQIDNETTRSHWHVTGIMVGDEYRPYPMREYRQAMIHEVVIINGEPDEGSAWALFEWLGPITGPGQGFAFRCVTRLIAAQNEAMAQDLYHSQMDASYRRQ